MKSIILITILTLGLLPGLAPKVEAQSCGQRSYVYISGYQRCGTPIYKVRYIAGYDRCGNPIWRARSLNRHERSYYYRNHSRNNSGYNHYSGYNGNAGYGRTRISYSSSGGRNYSYSYYSGSPSRCR